MRTWGGGRWAEGKEAGGAKEAGTAAGAGGSDDAGSDDGTAAGGSDDAAFAKALGTCRPSGAEAEAEAGANVGNLCGGTLYFLHTLW